MTRKTLALLAAAGSAALILAALGFQYLGEMPPCKLCYWQRYGHFMAIGAGVLAALSVAAPILLLGLLGALASALVGVFHTGVEREWWDGLQSCSAPDISGLTPAQAAERIMNAPVVRCDEVPWELLGLSMASWNAVASLALAALWVAALRRA